MQFDLRMEILCEDRGLNYYFAMIFRGLVLFKIDKTA